MWQVDMKRYQYRRVLFAGFRNGAGAPEHGILTRSTESAAEPKKSLVPMLRPPPSDFLWECITSDIDPEVSKPVREKKRRNEKKNRLLPCHVLGMMGSDVSS
jgi:hypothetical protein